MIQKQGKQVVRFIPQFIRAMRFLCSNFSEFILDGGVSVKTPFQYRWAEGHGKEAFQFRTVIQPDGDMINFVPNPDGFKEDSYWTRLYEANQRMHRAKVKTILRDLDGLYTIPVLFDMVLGFAVLIMPIRAILLREDRMISTVGLFLGWLVLTILLKRFINRYLSELLIRVLLKTRLWRTGLRRLIHAKTP
jgi:hypothetical protein